MLPIQIPDIPEARSEIVPARLARKVAPLFGVAWPDGPFGLRSWVCDYNRITLSEIARGAPSPSRGRTVQVQQRVGSGWMILDRIGVSAVGTTLPNVVPNATLNRFGPDTKAAVLLTAANRLLEPVTSAVRTAVDLLASRDGAVPGDRCRVVGWSALVLEAFRSQPALVAAALRARTVQRELLVDWSLPRAPSLTGLALARCEVGSEPAAPSGAVSRPRDLDLVDGTLHPVVRSGTADLSDLLSRELMAIGTRHSSGHLWLSERAPGQLVVEALVPPTEVLGRFVDRSAATPGGTRLPGLPDPDELSGHPVLVRRCVVLAVLAQLRDLRFDAEGRERERVRLPPVLRELDTLVVRTLDDGDPVRLVAGARIADMMLSTLRHDVRNDLTGPLRRLREHVERCTRAQAAGTLDRGAAAETVSSANVEINIVRRTNAARPDSTLPSPDELAGWLRKTWTAFGRALELGVDPPPPGSDADLRLAAGHHLHNYASFLSSLTEDEDALRAAVDLFRTVVLPVREGYLDRGHSATPLRQSLQTASRATTVLAARAAAGDQNAAARDWAALGLGWIRRALAEPETGALLAVVSEPAAHFALLAAPALLTAVEAGVPGAGYGDVDRARELVAVADGWAARVTGGDPANYVRAGEIVGLHARLCALSSLPA